MLHHKKYKNRSVKTLRTQLQKPYNKNKTCVCVFNVMANQNITVCTTKKPKNVCVKVLEKLRIATYFSRKTWALQVWCTIVDRTFSVLSQEFKGEIFCVLWHLWDTLSEDNNFYRHLIFWLFSSSFLWKPFFNFFVSVLWRVRIIKCIIMITSHDKLHSKFTLKFLIYIYKTFWNNTKCFMKCNVLIKDVLIIM
jgi:hypothetical protein